MPIAHQKMPNGFKKCQEPETGQWLLVLIYVDE